VYCFVSSRAPAQTKKQKEKQLRESKYSPQPIKLPATNVATPTSLETKQLAVKSTDQQQEQEDKARMWKTLASLHRKLGCEFDIEQRRVVDQTLTLQAEHLRYQTEAQAQKEQINRLMIQLEESKSQLTCHICEDHGANRTLVPCGHQICSTCLEKLPKNKCPFCQKHIERSVGFFLNAQ
jgi:hypothetical protein